MLSPATVVGYACRLPGASTPEAFWRALEDGRCTVADAPDGRWPTARFVHPRASEQGFAYTAAGGYIENPFSFDAAAFGISPREAQQMDPQQRLLLEVVWEALEDAGIPPSTLAGADVGVYVGASNVDYQSATSLDLAAMESHFMTGNSLSITANRISHVFDWHGPSMTVDTACSSSIVALAQAISDLDRGIVDTAVVAGVNMLLSPAPYVGFSRARMLSPTGRCRPFSADADGYVRSEGAVAFLLRRSDGAPFLRARATIVAAGVNSDGRTVGIALPSLEGQRTLLERLYGDVGISADDLAFVEAHGTGTRVGDPAEAGAIGAVLGRPRSTPLPVGSAKSNVGHLESASGAVGLLKAIQALQHGLYPRTLHLERLNPDIDFSDLNLSPAVTPVTLALGSSAYAGVCNYGFGGTNAHVIIRRPETPPDRLGALPAIAPAPRILLLSAKSSDALAALAGRCADVLEQGTLAPPMLAAGLAHQRDRLPVRAALPLGPVGTMVRSLSSLRAGDAIDVARGTALSPAGSLAFVYSGNGSQWDRMGRVALERSPSFLRHVRDIDALFAPRAGWSLEDRLTAPTLPDDLGQTSVAQPLIFAVQVALTLSLRDLGIIPKAVIGHSIGEIAAAWSAGVLDLEGAIRLILVRSSHQEASRDRGRMAVLACGEAVARDIVSEAAPGEVDIAALNSPTSTTISGTADGIARALASARARRTAGLQLDLAYPFHSRLLDGERRAVIAELEGLAPSPAKVLFVSSVTGTELPGESLGPVYWWRNVRDPVRFQQGIETAAAAGIDLFLEIGPKPLLVSAVSETLNRGGMAGTVLASLSDAEEAGGGDPILALAARLVANGCPTEGDVLLGCPPPVALDLPTYPWQRQRYVLPRTLEAMTVFGDVFGGPPPHPLLGYRMAAGSHEWRTCIDAVQVPFLADHRIGDDMVVPGAAFVEMALAVARTVWPDGPLMLEDMDILHPLTLAADAMRELAVTWAPVTRQVEIRSRPRTGSDEWTRHARVRIGRREGRPSTDLPVLAEGASDHTAEELYRRTSANGVNYGAAFRRVAKVRRDGNTSIVDFGPEREDEGDGSPFLLHPTALDATLHPFFLEWSSSDGRATAHLPIRIGRLTLWVDRPVVSRAVLRRVSEVGRTSVGSIIMLDAAGRVVATVERVVFRSVPVGRSADERIVRATWLTLDGSTGLEPPQGVPSAEQPDDGAAWRLVQGFALALAWRMAQHASSRNFQGAERFLAHLAANRLAEPVGDGWRLAAEGPPHEPEAILQALAALHPGANAEILLCNNALSRLRAGMDGDMVSVPRPLREQFETEAALVARAAAALATSADRWCRSQGGTPPTILVGAPWHGALIRALLPLARTGRARIALAGPDGHAYEDLMTRWGWIAGFSFIDLGQGGSDHDAAGLGLRLSLGSRGQDDDLPSLVAHLAPGARWIEAVAHPDIALALLLDEPADPAAASPDLRRAAGLTDPAIESEAVVGWSLLTASREKPASAAGQMITFCTGADPFGRTLAEHLFERAHGPEDWTIVDGEFELPDWDARRPGAFTIVDFVGLPIADKPAEQLKLAMLRLRDRLLQAERAGGPVRLWLLTRGAHAAEPDPVATALWTFGRVAANEFPSVDVRRVDIDPALAPDKAASRLIEVIRRPGRETEMLLRREGLALPRMLPGSATTTRAPAARERTVMTFPRPGKLTEHRWLIEDRRRPGAGEVEIAVSATGLNFRDVMLGMGLLDEDLLGGGLSQAALGFEMAGMVVAKGEGVPHLSVGDRVMGFAAGAFASHVTVSAGAVATVPEEVPLPAAATIPVAFATAWYALEEVARLQEGETVLIHGGAGGVGLAAIQVARARGARILATAGSPDRRHFVSLLGADAVFDSRSLAFADQIRTDEGGVDVILNSLSGEAMIQGLKLLRPFGRFLELGKRDYLENTSVDLRPFLRNVAYHNVDLDQLLADRPALGANVLREVVAGFADGRFVPLTYRLFDGDGVHQAFRLMQASGHVGKILVRPAREGSDPLARPATFRAPDGAIVVVGGTSGLGFETACWLARHGARTLVLASRRGTVPPGLAPRLEAMRADGVTVDLRRVDASDAGSVRTMVDETVRRHGAIAGVIHTAMVLSDGLMAAMTADAIETVLAPKVAGLLALEAALAGQPLVLRRLFVGRIARGKSGPGRLCRRQRLHGGRHAAAARGQAARARHRLGGHQRSRCPGRARWARAAAAAVDRAHGHPRGRRPRPTRPPPRRGLRHAAGRLCHRDRRRRGRQPAFGPAFARLRDVAVRQPEGAPLRAGCRLRAPAGRGPFGGGLAACPRHAGGRSGLDPPAAARRHRSDAISERVRHGLADGAGAADPGRETLPRRPADGVRGGPHPARPRRAPAGGPAARRGRDGPLGAGRRRCRLPRGPEAAAHGNRRARPRPGGGAGPREDGGSRTRPARRTVLMSDMRRPTRPGSSLADVARSVAAAPAPAAAMAISRAHRDTRFDTLSGFRQMSRQRALADMMGLENPYYRMHDAKAGATAVIGGKHCINFVSYDYLGLNGHPEVAAAVTEAVGAWGSSVSGSRMTAGERPMHRELERELAALYDADDAAVFVSGHATAVSTIASLVGPKDLVLMDALVHNCVLVGAQLSGATRRSFPHNDLAWLEETLQRERDRFDRVLIVTEGLFSMDGDGADLASLVDIKTRFGCWLMVDDAHGLGVLGKRGFGAGEHGGVDPRSVDLWLGTLSKSLVSCGGYVAGCQAVVDYLKHLAPGLVYSVGLPMPATAAALTALRIMRREPDRVERLQRNSRLLWHTARAFGFDTGTSWGYGIVPVVLGDSIETVILAQRLLGRGINTFPVVPPGVPDNTARLRFFVSADHTVEQIQAGLSGLREETERLRREGGAVQALSGFASGSVG